MANDLNTMHPRMYRNEKLMVNRKDSRIKNNPHF